MALFQLLGQDPNDLKLTNDLSQTLFKTKFATHESFVMNTMTQGINNTFRFGNVTDINVPQNGDYLYKLTLHANLPEIIVKYDNLKMSEIFDLLSTYEIKVDMQNDKYQYILDNKFGSQETYNLVINLVNNKLNEIKIVNKWINNVLRTNFDINVIEEIIIDEPNYSSYKLLEQYADSLNNIIDSDDENTNQSTSDSTTTSTNSNSPNYCTILDSTHIIKLVKKLLIKKIITKHDYTKDFKSLLNINIQDPLDTTINKLITTNEDTLLFKYVYSHGTDNYNSFFDYLEQEIQAQHGINEHLQSGCILCYQNKFNTLDPIILTTFQRDTLDQINELLQNVLSLLPNTLTNKLDNIASNPDFLDFNSDGLQIALYNLNTLIIIVLQDLKEYLHQYCMENCYEIRMLVNNVCEEIMYELFTKLRNILPIIIEQQNKLDEKINIVLSVDLILPEDLYKIFSKKLRKISKCSDIKNLLDHTKTHLVSSELNILLYKVKTLTNIYINSATKTPQDSNTSNTIQQIITEFNYVRTLVFDGFNNYKFLSRATPFATYDELIIEIFDQLVINEPFNNVFNTNIIKNLGEQLLIENYQTPYEFLKSLNIEPTTNILSCTNELNYPCYSVSYATALKTLLLNNTSNGKQNNSGRGILYEHANKHDVNYLERCIKNNNNLFTRITTNKTGLLKLIDNIYKNKTVKIPYIQYVGIKMIKKVDFYLGDILISTIYGDHMFAMHLLKDNIKNRANYQVLTSVNPIYVPLTFWFTEHIESALPICKITEKDIKLRVTLRDIRKLITIPKYCSYPSNLEFNGSLLAQYYYLADDDRTLITKQLTYNVIELVQKSGPDFITCDCLDNHDTVSIIYYLRRMVKTLVVAISEPNVIKCIQINYDGVPREPNKLFNYYNLIQPYEKYICDLNGFYICYSFALSPTTAQPSGNMDASNIKNVIIRYTLDTNKLCKIGTIKLNLYTSYYELLRFCKPCII